MVSKRLLNALTLVVVHNRGKMFFYHLRYDLVFINETVDYWIMERLI